MGKHLGERGWFLCAIVALGFVLTGHAVVANALELGRPVVSDLSAGHGALFLRGGMMSSKLDVMRYASRTPGSAKLNHFYRWSGGVRLGLTRSFSLGYEAGWTDQLALRTTEPTHIPSRVFSQKASAAYTLPLSRNLLMGLEAGYLSDRARKESFYRYAVGHMLVYMVDGRPLVTVSARDKGWFGAIRGRWQVNPDWRVHFGAELRRYAISTNMNSPSATVLRLLKSRIPQATPWHEYHAWLQGGVDWNLSQHWMLAVDYAHLHVSRKGYLARAGKPDLTGADRLDGYLVWRWKKGWSFHLHGRAQTHFLLGDLPLLYNTGSNHKYKKAFGFLSAGIGWDF